MPLSETAFFNRRADSGRALIKKLRKSLSAYMDAVTLDEISAAVEYGADAHKGQTRKSGEAYISHPVAVAEILGSMRMDSRTIIAAILHDVVEDTPITAKEIGLRFGEDVAHLVEGVSKVSQLEIDSKDSAEAASFRKMFMAMATDIRVIIIKLSDRLHNMHTLESLKDEKRQRISRQTLDIYAPIANRMGMRELANELEDLSLKNLYPKRYNAIQKMLQSNKRGRKPVIDQACDKIKETLERNNIEAEVVGREKSIYSIYRKALRKKKIELRDVQDIYAIRVITENRNLCYLAFGIIHNLYKPRPARFKDYIAIPKANGYQSLHTSVFGPFGQPIEIQIRSQSMHRIAESGLASHWIYKTDATEDSAPQQLAQRWLTSFLESQQLSGDSGEFIEHLKADLYPDEVYVFTPKGEIKRLPRGASALDFAYAVHSDIGNRCVGAKINHQTVPLHETLKNGDHIEIITSPRASPLPGWLNYAVTSKARSAIRAYLNKQKGKESLKLGNKLLKKALWDQGYRRLRIPSRHKIALLSATELKDWPELLTDIGFGKRLAPLVAKQLIAEAVDTKTKKQSSRTHDTTSDDPGLMTIEGTEGLLVNYAKCCHPIPNDRIIGTTTAERGLVIHRLRCPNSRHVMKHPDQFVHLNWSENTQGLFEVKLRLEAHNQRGVLSEITNIIATHGANINKLNTEEFGNTSRLHIVIEVKSRDHLADIMRELHGNDSIIKCLRERT